MAEAGGATLAEISFQLLGPLRAWRGGTEIALGPVKQRLVLAVVLLGAGRTVTREEIIDTVWGEHPPTSVVNVVQAYVGRLRALLDPDRMTRARGGWLITKSAGYQVSLDMVRLDLSEFRALVRQSRVTGQHDLDLLLRALDLWQGPCLDDFALEAREHLGTHAVDRERIDAVALAARVALPLGRAEETLPHLRTVAAAEPLDESIHAHLMLSLAATGAQVEALNRYQEITKRLATELGVDPSPQLRDAHRQVLRQDSVTLNLATRPGWRGPRPVRTGLIGRDDDLRELAKRVLENRGVTLVGAGGIGKTSLAYALAEKVGRSFPDGVAIVELGPLPADAGDSRGRPNENVEIVADAVRATLAIPANKSGLEDLLAALRDRRMLLVADNAEHVAGALSVLVTRLLSDCPGLSCVVTSRMPLGMAREVIWDVTPLAVPEEHAEPLGYAAVELFLRNAGGHCPDLDLSDQMSVVAALCRRLDGLPLAVELAAARLRTMSVQALLERIEHHGLLSVPRSSGLPHQRSVGESVQWSVRMLDQAERRLLDRLTVFAGEFALETAEAVAGFADLTRQQIAELLANLVDASLVQLTRGTQYRYRLLMPVRDVCRTMVSDDDLAAVRDSHLIFIRDLAVAAKGDDARLRLSFPDVIAALDWGLRPESPDPGPGVELLTAARPLWDRVGQLEALHRWTAQALAREEELSSALRGRLLLWAGRLAYVSERLPEAGSLLKRALDFLPENERSRRADIMLGIASISDMLLDADAADRAAAAVAEARKGADPARLVATCAGAALTFAWRDRLAEADRLIQDAYEAAGGDDSLEANCRWCHALVALRDGRFDEVERTTDRIIAGRDNETADAVVYALICRAWVRVFRGDLEDSFKFLDEARDVCVSTQRPLLLPEVDECSAYASWLAGRLAEAGEFLVSGLTGALERGDLSTALRGLHLAAGMASDVSHRHAADLVRLASQCRMRSRYALWPITDSQWQSWETATGLDADSGQDDAEDIENSISEAVRIALQFLRSDAANGEVPEDLWPPVWLSFSNHNAVGFIERHFDVLTIFVPRDLRVDVQSGYISRVEHLRTLEPARLVTAWSDVLIRRRIAPHHCCRVSRLAIALDGYLK